MNIVNFLLYRIQLILFKGNSRGRGKSVQVNVHKSQDYVHKELQQTRTVSAQVANLSSMENIKNR